MTKLALGIALGYMLSDIIDEVIQSIELGMRKAREGQAHKGTP